MKRKIAILCLILALVLLLTGCWNRRELNELAIAVGMGIDKQGDQFRVSLQVVDPGKASAKKGAGGGAPATLYTEEADTIFEAIRKITTISPRRMYFSHLRICVIGESMATEGMAKSLDLLSRYHQFRTDFYIVVSKGTSAEDTLKIMTPLDPIPANDLFSSLETSQKNWSPSTTVTLDELVSALTSEGMQPVLTGLRIVGNKETGETSGNVQEIAPSARLQYSGLAVFRKDRLIGWLNETESRGYNFIRGKVQSSVGFVACPRGGKVVSEIIRTQTTIKGNVYRGEPQVNIKMQVEANVGEVECNDLDLTQVGTIYDIEKKEEEKIEEIMKMAVRKAQKSYKADIFGFGEAIHRADPRTWKSIKKNWDYEHFAELPVNIKVNFKIRRLGTIGSSFLNDIKE
ncbi:MULTISPECIES: Ger(x)C family spore germination protein [Paenibacillus]|uniref:Ger(X)C family spore germination protein n=2 Tax=Paenibacillus TaxID=44249 RepID=A0AAJ3J3P1_PAEPO|nr:MULTISPECIES: Ger(x)C family spore germination protein [Paenibacillus]AHC17984.1 spore gernimation protein GerC [Paenibacillus polymyxa CR1]ALA40300.1 spore gernimation protein GerC [Paenibacillus peoriae]APB78005.1 Ger(x)C family spore germination protein [Paenibacillus polymyxa]APQ57527.1 spore gernimation protein GerC [Paenibacillus polymyxa]MCP3747337.1 Ger(x)C family spore germination protein [Paenibacillus sp. A3M_27_13]